MSQFCPIMALTHDGTPPADINIDHDLVRRLLQEQHPDLAALPLTFEQSGWDNCTFRLGNDLAIRLPRRQAAADLIDNEQKWLPMLSKHLPLSIPTPYRIGIPNKQYPWRWSILPWFPGIPADVEPPSADQTSIFAEFLMALHRPAPPQAPLNPFRGVPLIQRVAAVEERLKR
jgi:aminoglycoside phosphotransferase (APT) family kinase protein